MLRGKRINTNEKIDDAQREQEYYHQEMSSCFDKASEAYSYGNKADAPYYSQEGHSAKAKRDDWTTEVRRLISQAKSLNRPDNVSNYNFKSYKQAFERVKSEHERVQNEHSRTKKEHEEKREIFNRRKSEFQRAKQEFDKRLDFLKRENENRKKKLGEIALRADYFKSLAIKRAEELFEANAEPWKDAKTKKKRYQDVNDYCNVVVRSGWSTKFEKPTTDCLIFIHGNKKDHYHIIYDENGLELFSGWRPNH